MTTPPTQGDARPDPAPSRRNVTDPVPSRHDIAVESCHAELVEASARHDGGPCFDKLSMTLKAQGIVGVVPRTIVAPTTIEELAEIVRGLHGERKAFAFVGGGTELELGNPPRALDTVVRTTALNRVVDYAPEDQTITVEAGMTFAQLDAILAEHNQMLPLDVPDRARTTIGGALATNAYGPRRQRYGTAKDLIVGVTLVRPDGTRARGGGKVVKNVAGFDLPKMMVGSLGTLGAIATATLRLYPRPETRGAIRLDAECVLVKEVAAEVVRCRLEPAAMIGDVLVFEGVATGIAGQLATARNIARELGLQATVLDEAALAGIEARDSAARTEGAWRMKETFRPADAPPPLPFVPTERDESWYPLLGVRFTSFPDDPQVVPDRIGTSAFQSIVFTAIPPAHRGRLDAWGPAPPSFPLMRALKERFDPHGLCNAGRFVGGL
jgi:glycolate oxidase FAD binding subunit